MEVGSSKNPTFGMCMVNDRGGFSNFLGIAFSYILSIVTPTDPHIILQRSRLLESIQYENGFTVNMKIGLSLVRKQSQNKRIKVQTSDSVCNFH